VLRRFLCLLAALLAAPALQAAAVDAYGASFDRASRIIAGRQQNRLCENDARLARAGIADVNEAKLVGGVRMATSSCALSNGRRRSSSPHHGSSSMPMELRGEKTEWHLMSVYNLKTRKLSSLLDHVHGDTVTMNTVYGTPWCSTKRRDAALYPWHLHRRTNQSPVSHQLDQQCRNTGQARP